MHEAEQSLTAERPKPNYTGETLLRTRPKTYYKVIHMLAAGEAVCNIARQCKVATQTIDAIQKRRSVEITERKKTILANLSDVAELGSERMVQTVGKASFRDATIGTGVAVDKILALTNTTPLTTGVIVMPSDQDRDERRAIDAKLNAIAQRLNAQPPLTLQDRSK